MPAECSGTRDPPARPSSGTTEEPRPKHLPSLLLATSEQPRIEPRVVAHHSIQSQRSCSACPTFEDALKVARDMEDPHHSDGSSHDPIADTRRCEPRYLPSPKSKQLKMACFPGAAKLRHLDEPSRRLIQPITEPLGGLRSPLSPEVSSIDDYVGSSGI